ncbi:kallikrein 1-related peptidase b9-like [Photinus pyralis]|uniref:kallikrein 1-related peptidase b9-like n=1 Tax=Photinus pyralis TaxID=7054 RepID=UPI0012671DE4|nr:kallikrein 1-related peptidase b9-like [Photinus pyralis]
MLRRVLLIFATTLYSSIAQHSPDLQNLDSDVIAANKAIRYQFPYQVSIQRKIANSEYIHICSGAILSLTWVTTTAYCVTPPENHFRVVTGLLYRHAFDIDVQVMEVDVIVIHPDYKGGISGGDLALLQLRSWLGFTKSVQPIPLSYEEDTWGAAMLSSWKVQTRLFKSYSFKGLYYMIVYTLSEEECKNALSDKYNLSTKVLCTEKMEDGLFCPGESGSPLVSNGYLIGLTSWGFLPCGITVYTKISYFLDFIMMYVKDL